MEDCDFLLSIVILFLEPLQNHKKCQHLLKLHLLKNTLFTGTNRYFRKVAAEMGIDISFADCTKPQVLKAALKPNTKVRRALFVWQPDSF